MATTGRTSPSMSASVTGLPSALLNDRLPIVPATSAGVAVEPVASDDSVIYIAGTAYTVKRAVIHANTSGNNTIVAAVSGKKIRVIQLVLVVAGAMTVRFESAADGTALTGQMAFAANGGMAPPFTPPGYFETASGELLNLELSAATYVDGWLLYIEV